MLAVPPEQSVIFERFSDSAGTYIALDSNNPAVYKQLYRAAKAKLKLRIKATLSDTSSPKADSATTPNHLPAQRYTPPKNDSSPSLELKETEEHLLSGLVAPTVSPTTGAKPPFGDLEQYLHRHSLRPKLPYDPCLSPSVTAAATQSLLDTVNPVIHEADTKQRPNPANCAIRDPREDYEMQLMLLEQANKKRLLMARQDADRGAEAPVPRSFTAPLALESLTTSQPVNGFKDPVIDTKNSLVGGSFIISCNKCQANIPNAHWHCSTCNAGDFDLCGTCIANGILCESEDHWLIKRTVKDGKVLNSTTETIAPKAAVKMESKQDVPKVTFAPVSKEKSSASSAKSEDLSMYRTCNSCVEGQSGRKEFLSVWILTSLVFDDSKFVTCKTCEDFDLCVTCFLGSKHGHHPGHTFAPACSSTKLDSKATMLCAAGRNMRHYAICDGCDKVSLVYSTSCHST